MKLLKLTTLLFAGMLVFLFDPSLNQSLLAQPGSCDPDAPMRVVWPPDSAVTTEDTAWQLSADGRYTLFSRRIISTPGPYLNYLYRYDRLTCAVEDVAIGVDGQPVIGDYFPNMGSMSADGRYITFDGDNALYLRDMELQTTVEVVNFFTGFHSLSADGRYLAYWASRNNGDTVERGLFVYDRLNDSHETIVPFMNGDNPLNPSIHYYFHMAIAGQGRYIAIMSAAPLVAGDTNGSTDVFLYDRDTQTMALITEGYDGSQANGESEFIPDISADGRYVVFGSHASNLVPDDNNGAKDIFLYDRVSDSIERLNVNALGVEANGGSSEWFYSISADGRYVAFDSTATNLQYGAATAYASVYVLDRDTGLLKLVTVTPDGEGGEGGASAVLSDDGRFVAFMSRATDLAPGNDSGDIRVFLADWQELPTPLPGILQPETCDPDASVTVLLRDLDGAEIDAPAPLISQEGRYVVYTLTVLNAFSSYSIPYRYDRVTCETEIISITGDAMSYADNFGYSWVFSLSADGRYVLFYFNTEAEDLSGLYVQDMDTGALEKILVENTHSFASMSPDGRYVLYSQYYPINTSPGDRTSLWLYDRETDETEVVAIGVPGVDTPLFLTTMSEDNSVIVFASTADLLVPSDTNGTTDMFVYNRATQELNLITRGFDGSQSDGGILFPAVSADGRYIVYQFDGTNIVPGDTNNLPDVFLYDRDTGLTRRISVAEDGTESNGYSGDDYISISADGRYVTFSSDATNLIVGETHDTRGIYVYDQTTDDLWRATVDDYYTEGDITNSDPRISGDGQWIVYLAQQSIEAESWIDLFIVEWQTLIDGEIEEPTPLPPHPQPETCDPDASVTVLLRDPDGADISPSAPFISQDGRYVIYNLAMPYSSPYESIPYRYDRVTCETELISITGDATPYTLDSGSSWAHGLSADGRYVLFNFRADDTTLDGLYVQDMNTGTAEIVTDANIGLSSISGDGRFVMYNAYGSTNPGPSDNPNYDHVNLFLYDRDSDTTELIATMPFDLQPVSFFPVISDDNNTIVFTAEGDIPAFAGDTNQGPDVFAYERASQSLTRVTTGFDGSQPNGPITFPAVSADGRYITYQFHGTNIVAGDSNNVADIFLYDRDTGLTRRVSVAEDGTEGDAYSGEDYISISADGRYVTFSSDATNLIVGETHDTRGIYVYDQTTDNLWRTTVDDYYAEGYTTNGEPRISHDGQWITYLAYRNLEGESWIDLFIVEWQTLIDAGEDPDPSEPDAAPQRNVVIAGESLLAWGEITWAVAYEIQIDNDVDFSSPIYTDATLTVTELTVPDLPEGVYQWRVRAQRENGSWGDWSAADSFVVVAPES